MLENNAGIIVYGKTVSMTIMLPEKGDIDDIKKKMEEELKIYTGEVFIPFMYTKEAGGDIDFGSYGRRWCIRVNIDASKEESFFALLRDFCKKYNIVLNEKGDSPFKGLHHIFEK